MPRPRRRKLSFWEKLNLNPDINRGLLAILLFVSGGLSALSFFGLAGIVGIHVNDLLAIIFGSVRFFFPIILILIAILIIKDLDYNYQPTHWLGAILFFLSFNGLVYINKPLIQPLIWISNQSTWQGLVDFFRPIILNASDGGGMVGFILGLPLLKYLGYWGAMIILIGIIIMAVVFLFNTSLAQIVELHRKLFFAFGWLGKQIISLFALFKKDPQQTKFKINGKYKMGEKDNAEDGEYEEVEEYEKDEEQKEKIADEEDEEEIKEKNEEEEMDEKIKKPRVIIRDLPPINLLCTSKEKPTAGDIKASAETIKDTFANFGIEVSMGEVQVGPTVTQYSLKPAKGIKLSRITALGDDLALALAAHPIRTEAPIPGKALVGIEVPNKKVAMVSLRELLESKEWQKRPTNMQIALGKDVAGKVWFSDLPKMPHLLIAGATGSGKTVCINTVLLSLLYQNNASTLRLIMVDPKRVELTMYNGIPHLLTPVITDPKKTVNALRWSINEMNRRFDSLAQRGKRDINTYNASVAEEDRLPHIVFIIDELADLMAMAASEVEAGIIRLAQMARAVGIHLIVATQRPSTEVITGLMKANIPARIAFSVASQIDSRTILDCPGAEKLLGRGDMLYLTAELSKPKRIQGAFVSEEELQRVIKHLKGNEEPEYDETIISGHGTTENGTINMFGGADDDYDARFDEAKELILRTGKASASLLQRYLKIGYARAARVLDELEEAGIVGPADGAKPREVFTEHLRAQTEEELDDKDQTMDSGGVAVFDNDNEGGTEEDDKNIEKNEENDYNKNNEDDKKNDDENFEDLK